MLRTYKTLTAVSLLVFAMMFTASVTEAMTLNGVYFLNHYVSGVGVTPAESKSAAYANMEAKIIEVQNSLPPNHFVVHSQISREGWVLPTLYDIDFEIMVYVAGEGGGGIN